MEECQCCLISDYSPIDYASGGDGCYQCLNGQITRSDNGTKWLIQVDDSGHLTAIQYEN